MKLKSSHEYDTLKQCIIDAVLSENYTIRNADNNENARDDLIEHILINVSDDFDFEEE